MTPIEFCYWLQGWAELESGKKPTMEQWKSILDHLNLVFHKVTPPVEVSEESSEEETLDLDGPLCSPEQLMARLLDEAIDRVEDKPAQVVFNPPLGSRPPQLNLDRTTICSTEPDDKSFCVSRIPKRLFDE